MPPSVALVTVAVGSGLLNVVRAWTRGGPAVPFAGLFPLEGRDDWPRGVQEADVPHFAVEHTDALRPGSVDAHAAALEGTIGALDDPGDPAPEVVELYTRRLAPHD